MHKKYLLGLVSFCIIFGLHPFVGVAETEEDAYVLKEITVIGTRGERDTFNTPGAIFAVTPEEIARQRMGTAPDILCESAGVQVQKTTQGHGSPIIRGLTGYHTLIMIDGVRLNNSTFRSGPNQYMATIDPGQIERMEVMRGHGSALYGSSAMGGVINVITKSQMEFPKGLSLHPRVLTKFSSADMGKYVRMELDGGYKNLGFVIGGSYKDVEDLKPGKGYDIQLPSKKFLLTSQSHPKALPEGAWLVDKESPTGWKERNSDIKLNYKVSDGQNITLAYQAVRQQDVPRYDKLATKEFDKFFFDPQNRDLVFLSYTGRKASPFIDVLQASVSYHKQEEGQRQRKAKSSSLKEISDITNTTGLSLQLISPLGNQQKLTYGGEFYYDTVESKSVTTDLKSGEQKKKSWGTFPDGSTFWDMGFYLQDEVKFSDSLEAILAGRYTRFGTQSDLSVGDPAFGVFEDSGSAVTGSFGLVFHLAKSLNLTFSAGQSFRAPNLNDTTAVAVTNEGIDAPSLDLDSERGAGIDIGLKTRSRYFSGAVNYYFNRIYGLITRVPLESAYAGKDLPKLYKDLQDAYEGIPIFVRDNIEKANIQGVELEISRAGLPSFPEVSIYGNLTFTRGKDITNNEPIRREQPINGLFGIRWEDIKGRFWAEFYSRFADKQDRLSSGDRRDPRIPGLTSDPEEYDPMAYSPGWLTLNIRTGVNIGDQTRLSAGLENIANRRYREHGSGVDAPGINFFANAEHRF